MMHILKCPKCGRYTMKEVCACGGKTVASKPLKYSPDDKFVSYRRKAKLDDYSKKGLI